jgi:hypothetical protein
MNKKNKNIAIIGGLVFVAIILIYFFGLKQEKTKVITSWYKTYSPDDEGPYGTYMMKELLDTVGFLGEFIEIDNKLTEGLKDDPEQNDIYFFIGEENYMSEESCDKLLDFVFEGNTAFISAKNMPILLLDEFFINPYNVYHKVNDTHQKLKFTHPNLQSRIYSFKYIFKNKISKHEWVYFADNNFEVWEDKLGENHILGQSISGNNNFISFKYGEGEIFFHSTPYVFTNISMFKKLGFSYAENLLKHIPPGRVQWDKYNLRSHSLSTDSNNHGSKEKRSPLEFIFKHPALTWAFVILLITALLYMLFKSKRMQNIVKPAELKENTSLKYVQTVSSLYLQEKKNGKLIALKEKTFMNFIAEHYYLHSHNPDDKFIEKVAMKSQIDKEKIKEIFKMFNKLKGKDVVLDEVLIQLHHKIEYFYKNCK